LAQILRLVTASTKNDHLLGIDSTIAVSMLNEVGM